MIRTIRPGTPYQRCLAVHIHHAENRGVLDTIPRRPARHWLRDALGALMVLALALLLPMIAYVVMAP